MSPRATPPRKLVSLRNVSRIDPLTSSKTREVVMIGGWPVVVPEGEFTLNQLVLYFEIDSFLPFDDGRFEQYRSLYASAELHGEKGLVVQTVMIDDHVSQGMVFCTDDFSEVDEVKANMNEDNRGSESDGSDVQTKVDAMMMDVDFTQIFKVQRWITFCEPLRWRAVSRTTALFPDVLPDTKLRRAQDLPNLWKKHGNREFEITEMLDGIPVTVYKVNAHSKEYLELPGTLVSDSTGLFFKRPGLGISVGDRDYEETKDSRSWQTLRDRGILDALGGSSSYNQAALAGVLCGVGIADNLEPSQDQGPPVFRACHL